MDGGRCKTEVKPLIGYDDLMIGSLPPATAGGNAAWCRCPQNEKDEQLGKGSCYKTIINAYNIFYYPLRVVVNNIQYSIFFA